MKLLRYLVIGVNVVAGLAVIAIGIAAWLLSSEGGTAWLVRTALRAVPVLNVAGTRGTLSDVLVLRGIELRLPNDDIDIAEIRVSLDLGQLLARAVVLEELVMSPVVVRHRSGTASSDSEALDLPVAIVVRDATLAGLDLSIDDVTTQFGQTRFAGTLIGAALEVERLESDVQGVEFSGNGRVDLEAEFGVDIDFSWTGQFGEQRFAGQGSANGRLPEIAVEHQLSLPFSASAVGRVDLDAGPGFVLSVNWADLAWPDFELVTSPSGSAELTGSLDMITFSGAGDLRVDGVLYAFDAAGGFAGSRIAVEQLVLSNAAGELSGTGELSIENLEWAFEIESRNLDPSTYLADWPGRIDATGTLRGGLRPALHLEFEAFELAGQLRDFPITATAAGRYEAPNVWRFEQVAILSGDDSVTLRGTVADALDLNFEASLRELGLLWPELDGELEASFTVGGTLAAPRARGDLQAAGLRYATHAIDALSLSGEIDLYAGGVVDVTVMASGLNAGNLNADTLVARAAGTVQSHALDIVLGASDWRTEVSASGAYAAGGWRGRLERWDVNPAALGLWQLREPVQLRLETGAVVVDRLCIGRDEADFCAALSYAGTAEDRLVLEARAFDLLLLQPLLPAPLRLQGSYTLDASFSDLSGSAQGDIALSGGTTRLSYTASERDVVETVIDSVSLEANLSSGRLDLQLALDGRDTGQVDIEAVLADVRNRDSAVLGRVEAVWSDLEVLSLVSPDIGAVSGAVAVVLDLAGTVQAPEVQGRAQWSRGTVELPAWGVAVDRIEASAVSVDGTALEFDARGWVEDAELLLVGRSRLDPAEGWPTELTLSGEAVPIVQLPEAEVYVSPDLEIDVVLPQLAVSGTVLVPRARLSIDELPEQAVRPSGDTVVHGIEDAEAVRPLNVSADIRLVLGDDVTYTGSNLNSTLGGDLRVLYNSGQSANAAGSLSIAGSYDAYGQSLALDRGELIFTGPLDNPALDVRAVRSIGETTVGVQLTGTVLAPETRMFSDPAMSEADALAYLLLGRPLAGSGDEDSATVQSAALSMGLQQALPVVQRIGETLGFDEFSVGANDIDSGALMAGKYLSPKLYIRYSYGLFNRIGGLLLRFRINEYLSIETRSGDQKSMDVLYTIEKD